MSKSYEQLVAEAKEAVRKIDDCNWIIGDLSISAVRYHTRGTDRKGIGRYKEGPVRQWAKDIGWERSIGHLNEIRRTAQAWPKKYRCRGASWSAHVSLASNPNRFNLIRPGMTSEEARRIHGTAPKYSLSKVLTIQDVYSRLRASASWMKSATNLIGALTLTEEQLETLAPLVDQVDEAWSDLLDVVGMREAVPS